MATAKLTYWERNPPFAAIGAASLAKVLLPHEADPKATKETVPTITFSTG
jgi:glutamyl-tRNA synthetase